MGCAVGVGVLWRVNDRYLGFIESYQDPFGVRGEWEGFCAVVNRAVSAKFQVREKEDIKKPKRTAKKRKRKRKKHRQRRLQKKNKKKQTEEAQEREKRKEKKKE